MKKVSNPVRYGNVRPVEWGFCNLYTGKLFMPEYKPSNDSFMYGTEEVEHHEELAILLGYKSKRDALLRGNLIAFETYSTGTMGMDAWRGNKATLLGMAKLVKALKSATGDISWSFYNAGDPGEAYGPAEAEKKLTSRSRVANPDWSRESMKTILEWGWVAPDGRVIIGKRKDGTHEKLAHSAGLGYSWEDAVKKGSVRYILFTDGLLGLTLVPTKETISKALTILKLPQVLEVSIEWLDPKTHQIDQTKPLTVRQAALNMRAKLSGVQANPSYHSSGEPYPWGFLGLKTDHNGLKADDSVTNHDKLSTTLGFKDEEDAMRSGDLIRYFYNRDSYSEGNSLTLYMTMADTKTKQKADRLLKWLSASEVEPKHVVLDVFKYGRRREFTPVLGLAGEDNLAHTKSILKRLAAGETVTGDYFNGKVWTGQNPATRNPRLTAKHYADFNKQLEQDGSANGFYDEDTRTLYYVDYNDPDADDHGGLARKLWGSDLHTAVHNGMVRFAVDENEIGVSVWHTNLEAAIEFLRFVPMKHDTYVDVVGPGREVKSVHGSSPKEAEYKLLDLSRSRNGLHHADSPRNWPQGWDDFDGLPWGFIAPDGTLVDGLAHDEDVNEHDTLAALHIFGKEGMDSAEWKAMESGYIRYLVNSYKGLDPPYRLGLDGIGKFGQIAAAMIKGYKQLDFPVGAFDAGIHDPSQRPSKQDVYLSGEPKRILGALKRLAAGETMDEVQQMLRSTASQENPYAFSKHVTRFGFIKPNAAVVNAKKDELAHQEVAQRLGFPTEHAALSKGGLVRFLVYKDGQSDMEIDTDLSKVAGAIKGFVTKSPDINGIVTLDAPRATPYWSIHANSPKEFLARMNARVAGRVENPNYYAGSEYHFGFIDPSGRIRQSTQAGHHAELAAEMISKGLLKPLDIKGVDEAVWAMALGWVRWVYEDKELWLEARVYTPEIKATILKGLNNLPFLPQEVLVEFSDSGEYNVSGTSIKQVVGKLRRLKLRVDEEENPVYFMHRKSPEWGWIDPDGKLINGLTADYNAGPNGSIHDELAKHHGGNADQFLDKGYVRFFVTNTGDLYFSVSGTSPDRTKKALLNAAKYAKNSQYVNSHVVADITYDWPGAPTDETISAEFFEVDNAVEQLRWIARGNWPDPEDDDYWHTGSDTLLARTMNPTQNGAHWSSGIHASNVPWGLFNKTKIVSGLDTDGVRDHDELARMIGLHDEENALLKGWVRYIFINDFKGLVLGMTVYHNNPDEMAEIIMAQVPKLEMTPEFVDLDIREVGGDHVTGRYKGWNKARAVLKRIASGGDLIEIMPLPGGSKNPTHSGKSYPFKIREKSSDLYEVEFFDHHKVMVGTKELHGSLVWTWVSTTDDSHGETRDNLKSVLTDLSLMADQHTGRKGGAMKFVIYGKTGKPLGTVSAPNRAAARDKLRGQLDKLSVKTTADLFLFPYLNSPKDVREEADSGLTI